MKINKIHHLLIQDLITVIRNRHTQDLIQVRIKNLLIQGLIQTRTVIIDHHLLIQNHRVQQTEQTITELTVLQIDKHTQVQVQEVHITEVHQVQGQVILDQVLQVQGVQVHQVEEDKNIFLNC
jgi:hypothetical protein